MVSDVVIRYYDPTASDYSIGLQHRIIATDYSNGLWEWIIATDYGNGLWERIIATDYSNGLWERIIATDAYMFNSETKRYDFLQDSISRRLYNMTSKLLIYILYEWRVRMASRTWL